MISHSGDDLDTLIRWALSRQLRHVRPSPEVWGKIELRLTGCTARGKGIWRSLTRRMRGFFPPEEALGRMKHPVMFNGWLSYTHPSLACLVEQYMTILRIGWAT
jgi:hypothetical protein